VGGADITTNGNVTGAPGAPGAFGINAVTSAAGTFLKITTGAGTTVTGNFSAISALNYGRGNLEILTNGAVIGSDTGISANNRGSAGLDITANGNVTGTNYFGVSAYNSAAGSFLKITTAASTTVTGGQRGIDARNYGTGALDITANGNVTGTSTYGIYAQNGTSVTPAGTDLTVTTAAGTTVTGGQTGIRTLNYGTGALDVAANGNVTGTNNDGIFARNQNGTDLSVTTGPGTTVTGDNSGIIARNYGMGAVDVTANGNVTGTDAYGIYARNNNSMGTDLTVTTGAGTTVTGANYGIIATNFGSGLVDVTANGNVTGTSATGILARNSVDGTDLSVTTATGTSIIGDSFGIRAFNFGSGALDVTVNGNVTGTNKAGIAVQNQGTSTTVTTAAGTTVSGAYGIVAGTDGSGPLTITANGNVTGTAGDGIYAESFGGAPINITVAATSTVTGTGFAAHGIRTGGAAADVTVAGTINGGAGGAISFDCGCTDDRLELHTTAVVNGLVLAGGGTDTFVLGGDTGTASFNVSVIGTQYLDFEVFEKEDASHWTLTGINGDTGAWTVNGGLLSVNATMAGWNFTVNGGTLGGSGTIGDLFALSGGTIAPGNSIDTLNVANATFNAGSFYEVEINDAGNSDKIAATGTATLNGGTVNVLALPGTYVANTQYTIITTVSGRTGAFAGSTDNLAFLDAVLGYDAFNVYLNLVANATVFSDIAQTPNQKAVAGALDTLPPGDPLVAALTGQTTAGALQAFDALSGEIHASVGGMLIDESHFLRDAIFSRLLQAFYGGGGATNFAALAGNGPTVAALGGAPMMGLGMGKGGGKAAPAPSSTGIVAWTQGFGSWGDFKSDGNAASADRTLGGFVSGIDAGFGGGWRAGLAGGYTQTSASVDARGSSVDIDSYHLAAYAGGGLGPLALRSGAAWTWHEIETERAIVFPGFFQRADASYDGDTGQLFGELAMPLGSGKTALEAFGRLAYVHVSTGGFTESGGIAALTAPENDENVTYSTLGARAATTMFIDGMHVTQHASAAWQHAFGDVTTDMALAFAGNGAGFIIAGVPIARDSAFLEAGLDFRIAPDTTLGISYQGQIASDVQDHGLSGRLDWRF
jgi:outer membrane autotransporter protein